VINANSGFVAVVVGAFGSLKDVEVRNSAPGIAVILIRGSTAERILAITSANNGSGCHLQPDAAAPSVLQDSACIATAPGGAGVSSSLGVTPGVNAVARLRNVTAVGTGPSSAGVRVSSSGNGGRVTVDALNVIASGADTDISATGASAGAGAFAEFSFSAFDSEFEAVNGSVSDPGSDSNLTRPPLLANPAAGDVHQRAGSWTIDRGSRNLGGRRDIDGEERYQGAAPDIGADEWNVLQQGRRCFGETATILASGPGPVIGTPRRDVIIGTGGHDVIDSSGGADLICSLGGRDTIRAGGGNDKVKAAGAGDKLFGQRGADRLLGGGGRDRIKGGAGKDLLVGQGGADRLAGGGGRDRCGNASVKDRSVGCP
jgi:Ca2+-binding RTX toxin-like protein